MEPPPSLPSVESAPDVLEDGHLWLLEHVDGYRLRFTVEAGGWLAFADADGPFDDVVPPQFRHAVRHVREAIDRPVLAEVADDAVFYGVATACRRIEYDWDHLPPFLGVDVRAAGQFLPPDAAERAFDRVGLEPVNAFEKEVAGRHFSASAWNVPDSRWYDGPPLGVVVRNKAGGRALLRTPGFEPDAPNSPAADPVAAADRLTTPERIDAAIRALPDEPHAIDLDAVRERVVERVVREAWGAIGGPDGPSDPDAVVEAIEASTREYLVAERPDLVG